MTTPHTVFQNRRLSQSAPRLIALLIAIAVASFSASPGLLASHVAAAHSDVVVQTTTALPLTGTFQTVSNLFGDQVFAAPVLAQHGKTNVKTDSRILYHNGPVMQGSSNVYLIWYGNWAGNTATTVLTELVIGLGTSAYFQINTQYPDALGNGPNGGLIYSGTVSPGYSHGTALSRADIQDIVRQMIFGSHLPLDGAGIYIVAGSADVTDVQPDGSSFCSRKFPHHGMFDLSGAQVKYGFLGNPDRCPSTVPPGSGPLTPNDNFGADAMASQLAHLLNVIVTSPMGSGGEFGGWYDRYGFENAAKCWGTFGQTYQAPNGALANIKIGTRDFLIQQNWVNARKGFCAMALPAP